MSADEPDDHVREFDCTGCGRHIISLCEPPGMPDICGLCMWMPGWFKDPQLRERLDPGYEVPTKH